jgi:tetratricopeptide (TPR) repeat protein
MKIKSLILILFFITPELNSQDFSKQINLGNKYFIGGEFEKAIQVYEEIISSGYEAADLYYNLGNAYFKSNKITLAILNYERAILLAPNDEDIQYNLTVARTFTIDKIEALPQFFISQWHHVLVNLFSSDKWAVISIISFITFLLLFSIYLYINIYRVKKISFWLSIIILIISVSAFIFSFHHKEIVTKHNTAIIFSPSVTVKSSPDESGTDLFVIHEGIKVSVVDSLGNWTEIKLSNGNKGWLPNSAIVRI